MEIAIVAILLLLVIVCIIAVCKKEDKSNMRTSSSNSTPRFGTPEDTIETTAGTIESIFRKYYNSALIVAKLSNIKNNPEFELLPAIYTICAYATSKLSEDKQFEIMDKLVYELFYEVYPKLDAGVLSKRLNLYAEAIKNKNIRYLWADGNKYIFDDNLISNCAAIWGDITYNPKCADDYYNTPDFSQNRAEELVFSKTVKFINNSFTDFFQDFYKAVVLPCLPAEYANKEDGTKENDKISLLKDLFNRYYKSMLTITKRSNISCNAEFELLPAIFMICDYAAEVSHKDTSKIRITLKNEIWRIYPKIDPKKFIERLNLYQKALEGKKLRCEWRFDEHAPFNDDPASTCVALLGDILCNPNCADDYDNAPIFLHGALSLLSFSIDVVCALHGELVALFKDIYNLKI